MSLLIKLNVIHDFEYILDIIWQNPLKTDSQVISIENNVTYRFTDERIQDTNPVRQRPRLVNHLDNAINGVQRCSRHSTWICKRKII